MRTAFGAAAEQYDRGRPGWPADAIAAVLVRFGARRVLDLAAGTGKLTRVLAEYADEVVAVEPLAGMRRVLAEQLPAARALEGSAEAIPLGDASVDAAFVAEAFHWFDLPRAAAELARVVRPGGGLALMWNVPVDDPAWAAEVLDVVAERRAEGGGMRRRDTVPWREALAAEPRWGPLADSVVEHEQRTDRERIVDMIASFSAIAALPDDRRGAALDAVREVLDRHGIDEVTLRYRALITTARRADG